jgi:hypothetical protein
MPLEFRFFVIARRFPGVIYFVFDKQLLKCIGGKVARLLFCIRCSFHFFQHIASPSQSGRGQECEEWENDRVD